MRRLAIPTALAALSLLFVAARVLPVAPVVFPAEGEVRLLGVDAYYHARHARLAAESFPRLQREDPWALYPWRQRSDSAGLYDLGVAAVARVVSGGGVASADTVHRVAAWSPVLLAVAALLTLFGFVRRLAGTPVALGACALWVAFPGPSLTRTLLGFSDHHAAEIALGLGVVWGLWSTLTRDREVPAPGGWWWRADLVRAWPLAVFLLTWRGAPLFVLLSGLATWLVLTLEIGRGGESEAISRRVWSWSLAVLLLAGGPGLLAPWLVLDTDLWPSALLACGGIGVGAVGYAALLETAVRRGAARRHAAIVGLLLGGIAALVVAFHPLAPALAAAVFAPKSELLREHDSVTAIIVWRELGPVAPLAILGIVLGTAAVRRRRRPPGFLVPLLFAAALPAMWWATGDYGYAPPPHLALAAALAVALALDGVSLAWRRVALAALAALAVASVATGSVRPPWVTAPERAVLAVAHDGWQQAMAWLRRQPPVTEGAHEGVACAWDFGNFVAELGRHVPVYSRYPIPEAAAWLVAESETEGLARLCAWCRPHHRVRYAILDAHTVGDQFLGQAKLAGVSLDAYRDLAGKVRVDGRERPRWTFGPRFDRSLAARLYLRDGDGYGQLRLVYESPHQSFTAYRAMVARETRQAASGSVVRLTQPITSDAERRRFERLATRDGHADGAGGYVYDGYVGASVKIFEQVAGARVGGTTAPGTRIDGLLELEVPTTGRRLRWLGAAVADEHGVFEIVVPYSTDRLGIDAGTVRARGPLQLRVEDGAGPARLLRTLEIPARAVREGGAIALGPVGS